MVITVLIFVMRKQSGGPGRENAAVVPIVFLLTRIPQGELFPHVVPAKPVSGGFSVRNVSLMRLKGVSPRSEGLAQKKRRRRKRKNGATITAPVILWGQMRPQAFSVT